MDVDRPSRKYSAGGWIFRLKAEATKPTSWLPPSGGSTTFRWKHRLQVEAPPSGGSTAFRWKHRLQVEAPPSGGSTAFRWKHRRGSTLEVVLQHELDDPAASLQVDLPE